MSPIQQLIVVQLVSILVQDGWSSVRILGSSFFYRYVGFAWRCMRLARCFAACARMALCTVAFRRVYAPSAAFFSIGARSFVGGCTLCRAFFSIGACSFVGGLFSFVWRSPCAQQVRRFDYRAAVLNRLVALVLRTLVHTALPCLFFTCSSRHGLATSLSILSFHSKPYGAMADVLHGFDLNVRMEEDDDGNLSFNLNEPILEDHNSNGNVLILTHFFLSCFYIHTVFMLLQTFRHQKPTTSNKTCSISTSRKITTAVIHHFDLSFR